MKDEVFTQQLGHELHTEPLCDAAASGLHLSDLACCTRQSFYECAVQPEPVNKPSQGEAESPAEGFQTAQKYLCTSEYCSYLRCGKRSLLWITTPATVATTATLPMRVDS